MIGDPDRAEEFEAMSPDEYAGHKRIEIQNPFSAGTRSTERRSTWHAALLVAELEEENQTLNDKRDFFLDIVVEGGRAVWRGGHKGLPLQQRVTSNEIFTE